MASARSYLRLIAHTMAITYRQNMIDGFIIFTIIVQPLLVALLGLWMLRDLGPDYAIYVVVGSGMSGLWSSVLFVSGNSIRTERRFGTLETLTGVPSPLVVVVFGKTLANVAQSLLSMVGTYTLVSVILGYPLTVALPGAFIVSIVLVVVAFIAFGLVIASLFVLNPEVQQFQNGIEFPVFVLSGFLFPILMLPIWTRPVSYLLPTYWAARAVHSAARGTATLPQVAQSWAMLLALSAVFFAISAGLFRMVIRRAKIEGTLDAQ